MVINRVLDSFILVLAKAARTTTARFAWLSRQRHMIRLL